jgi:hypothetical protein
MCLGPFFIILAPVPLEQSLNFLHLRLKWNEVEVSDFLLLVITPGVSEQSLLKLTHTCEATSVIV